MFCLVAGTLVHHLESSMTTGSVSYQRHSQPLSLTRVLGGTKSSILYCIFDRDRWWDWLMLQQHILLHLRLGFTCYPNSAVLPIYFIGIQVAHCLHFLITS